MADPSDASAFVWQLASEPGREISGPHPAAENAGPSIDIDQVTREAFERGRREGHAAGVAQECERSQAELARLVTSLDRLASARGEMIHATEHQMVELALAIARRIVQREVTLERDLLVSMAHVALHRLEHGVAVTVHFNPEDYASTIAAQTKRWAGMPVTVAPDSGLARGEIRVDSAFGRVQAGVEAQLQEVGLALLGAPAPETHAA